MPLTRRFPSERDHLFLMSFACEKAEDECSLRPRLANFMAESQHPLLMLVNSCPEFFLYIKNWASHTLFLLGNQAICTVIKLSNRSSPSSKCCLSLSNLSRDCVWITEPNSVLITMSQGRSGGGEATDRFLAVLHELAK